MVSLSITAVRLVCSGSSQVAALRHVTQKIDAFLLSDSGHWTLESASERGFLCLLDQLLKREWPGFNRKCRVQRLITALKKGYDLPVLKWWLDNYMKTRYSMSGVCELAIEFAQIHVLQWLLDEGQLILSGNPLLTCNSREIAYWLYENGRHLQVTINVNASDGLDFINWCMVIEDNSDCSLTIDWSNIDAVELGSLEFLQRQHVDLPNENAIEVALRNGNLAVAIWLYQSYPKHYFPDVKYGDCDCEFDEMCQLCTWNRVDLDVAKFLFGEFEWVMNGARLACMHKMAIGAAGTCKLDVLEYFSKVFESPQTQVLYPNCIDEAAANGHLSAIQWLHNRGQHCTTKAMDLAATNGFMDIVLWLQGNRSEGCTSDAMDGAAENGHLETLQWLHENRTEGCTAMAMDLAAMNGHLSVIQWLHLHRPEGCTTYAMDIAASNGHLKVIQWLHENRAEGCTARALDEAASRGFLEIIQWLHANRTEGCSDYAQVGAFYNGHLNVFQWLHEYQTERCTQQMFTTHNDYSSCQLDILEFATCHSEYISLGVAVDILVENGRFGAAESLLHDAQRGGIPLIDSQYVTSW